MTLPALAPRPLVILPDHAEEYLRGLGIPIAAVRQAVQVGDQRAADIDRFYPRNAAGLTRWLGTVGDLRRSMATEENWLAKDARNRPTCENADGTVTLSVVGCNGATGDPASDVGPRARNQRGPATIAAVKDQLELITVAALISTEKAPAGSDPAPLGQWFVLYYRSDDAVRVEVSKAVDIDENGQFTGWLVRVILDPYEPENADPAARPLDVGGGDVDFTVIAAS